MSSVLQAEADSLEWVSVKSSTVKRIAYSASFSRLFVDFKSGGMYAYDGVPKAIYDAFLVAPSKGQFVYYTIRAKGTDSYYAVRKVG